MKRSNEPFEVFVINQWQTKGVQKDTVIFIYGNHDMVRSTINRNQFYMPHQWFETQQAANKKADELRLKNIASLTKKIEKLKNLKFT